MDIRGIIDAAEIGLLIPAILAICVVGAYRLSFGLHGFRRESRKDFLQTWTSFSSPDPLARSVAIRHVFGEYLPTAVVSIGSSSPNPGRTLLDLAEAWNLFFFDDASGMLRWKARRHRSATWRRIEGFLMILAMFFATWVAILVAVIAVQLESPSAWVLWLLVPTLFGISLSSSLHRDALVCGERVTKTWGGFQKID